MSNYSGSRCWLHLSALTVAVWLPDAALSQKPPTSALEEVIVTARRTEESLQAVPVTVAAFDDAALRRMSIMETKDLMFSVPGFYAQGGGSKENAVYYLRGQGRSVGGAGQPGVVTYLAEVPLPVFASSLPQYDLANIQVLKGPQGTLFGKNTTGGAVLIYPETPTYRFEGYLKGGAGSYNWRDVEGAVNVPLVDDKVAVRFAGRITRRDGYTENVGTGGDLDDVHSNAYRLSLLLEPTERFKNTLIYDFHRTKEAGQAMVLEEVTPVAATLGLDQLMNLRFAEQRARGPRKVDYGDFRPRSEVDQWGVFNRLELALGRGVELINISGYREQEWIYDANTDALPDAVGLLDALNIYTTKQYSSELQLRGSAFDEQLDWLIGGFYLKAEPDGFNGNSFPQFFGQIPGAFGYFYNEEESKALFAHVTIDMSRWAQGLSFSAGYRYTWDEYEACTGRSFTGTPDVKPDDCSATHPLLQPGTAADLSTDSSAGTWTIGLDWQITDELFTYVTTRRGYRGGGLNLPALGPRLTGLQAYDPEEVTDLEIGLRSDWNISGWQTRFNISAFQIEATDTQLNVNGLVTQPGCTADDPVFGAPPFTSDGDCNPSNDPTNAGLLVNVGDQTISGIELELSIAPIEALTLGLTASVMDHDTDKFSVPASVAFYTDAAQDELPFDYMPRKSATAYLRYLRPLPHNLGELVLSADFYWSDEISMLAYQADAYDITNLRLDWNDAVGQPLDFSLFVRNVFDEDAVVAGALNPPGVPVISVLYNEPRLFGMEVRYRFGG